MTTSRFFRSLLLTKSNNRTPRLNRKTLTLQTLEQREVPAVVSAFDPVSGLLQVDIDGNSPGTKLNLTVLRDGRLFNAASRTYLTDSQTGGDIQSEGVRSILINGSELADVIKLSGVTAGRFQNLNGGQITINGGGGGDRITGTGFGDSIDAGAGNDFVAGYAGDDRISGGGGRDRLFGQTGADIIFGGDGDDRLDGGYGDDNLEGGVGRDNFFGGKGSDTAIDFCPTLDVNCRLLVRGIENFRAPYVPGSLLIKWHDGTAISSEMAQTMSALGNQLYVLDLDPNVSMAITMDSFSRLEGVEFVQPNYLYQISGKPNDGSFRKLWGMNNTGQTGGKSDADIDAPEAWNTSTGTGQTIVAVIDTGVDYNHPDLAANMWRNTREIPGNGVDDDGNGYKDDVFGYDFVNKDSDPKDDHGHGTHVAGTIGAVGDNGVGVAGVIWHTKIMALKFLGANGYGTTRGAIDALNYAVANGARVINNSYGGGDYDPAFSAAIKQAREKGVIFVAAAGNASENNDLVPAYPASYKSDNVVSVAATDHNDRLAGFSNYGAATVHLAAPGVGVYSTIPGGSYDTYSGTSMATPHVVGAMALVWDAHPNWNYKQVIEAVLKSSDQLPNLIGKVTTSGRLNVERAINYTFDAPAPSVPVAPTNLRATNVGTRTIDLAFTDNSNNETEFGIAWSQDGGSTWNNVGVVGANVTSFQVGDLQTNTRYLFQVRAANDAGFSDYSNTIDVTTRIETPATPSTLRAANVWARAIDLNWNDNSTNETEFRIAISRNGGTTWDNVGVVGANSTSFRVTNLNPNTRYLFKVRAANDAGFSDYSNILDVRTRS